MLLENPVILPKYETTSKWTLLTKLWSQGSVSFTEESDGWRIKEHIGNTETFSLRRDFITKNRYTDVDKFGLLGLSLLNLNDRSVFITEGVSDYFTTKILLGKNVLGVTQLGGSQIAKKIIISLFHHATIIADNDITGLLNAQRWKSFLNNYNIASKIWQPSIGKDITDEFLFNYKFSLNSDGAVQF